LGSSAFLSHTLADHPVCFFSALSLEKNTPSVGLCDVIGVSCVSVFMRFWYIEPQKCRRRKMGEWTNDMAGGPTRALPLSGGERRPTRHGANTSHQGGKTRRISS
jgi:hypothetical protein